MLSLNYRTQGEHLATQFYGQWTAALLVMIWLGPINTLNGLLSVYSRGCTGHEIMWPRELCFLRRKLT